MEKEKLQEFAVRVSQANRSELVVIIYEAALASIAEGKKQLEAGEISAARKEIDRARGMIDELMRSLDMQYTISHYLRQLYIYSYHELCQGIALRQPELFSHAANVLAVSFSCTLFRLKFARSAVILVLIFIFSVLSAHILNKTFCYPVQIPVLCTF